MGHCEAARARVGASALRVLNQYGINDATEMYKGGFAALAICLITTIGREATEQLFRDVVAPYPPQRTRPLLVVDNAVRYIPIQTDGAA